MSTTTRSNAPPHKQPGLLKLLVKAFNPFHTANGARELGPMTEESSLGAEFETHIRTIVSNSGLCFSEDELKRLRAKEAKGWKKECAARLAYAKRFKHRFQTEAQMHRVES